MYHILASGEIKECKCRGNCRAKHGQFGNLTAAKKFVTSSANSTKPPKTPTKSSIAVKKNAASKKSKLQPSDNSVSENTVTTKKAAASLPKKPTGAKKTSGDSSPSSKRQKKKPVSKTDPKKLTKKKSGDFTTDLNDRIPTPSMKNPIVSDVVDEDETIDMDNSGAPTFFDEVLKERELKETLLGLEVVEEDHADSETLDDDSDEDFWNDDLEVLAGDDTLMELNKSSALFKQQENVISWSIENLYDEKGKLRRKDSLRKRPPVFSIDDSLGNSVNFVLTKNLSHSLSEEFEAVYRAYFGVSTKKKFGSTEDDSIVTWMKNHTFLTVLLAVLFVLGLIIGFTI